MAISHRILLVLLAVRLLMPPGICICKLSCPATRFVAHAFGTESPTHSEEEEDDHLPGCPASELAQGMGLKPAGPPAPSLDLANVQLFVLPPHGSLLVAPSAVSSAAPPSGPPPAKGPFYLTLCALLL